MVFLNNILLAAITQAKPMDCNAYLSSDKYSNILFCLCKISNVLSNCHNL